ncbi:MAG: hypothetical protein ACRC67_01390 [Inquilinus sp.]|uniref:hypothetical protein n=1 Tax=Inquilinus sp. TaxID=1932117 RepID=UPI003F3B1E23
MKRSLRTILCALSTAALAISIASAIAAPSLAQEAGQSPWADPRIYANFQLKTRLFARPNDIPVQARAVEPFPDHDPTGLFSDKDLRQLRWGSAPTDRLIVGQAEIQGGTLILSEIWAGGACSSDKSGQFCPAKLVLRRPSKANVVLFDGDLSMPSGTARYVRADLSAIESPERKGGWAPLEKAR